MICARDPLFDTRQQMQSLRDAVDKFAPLVVDLNVDASMTTDQRVYEICHGIGRFVSDWLGFHPLCEVIHGNHYADVPLRGFWEAAYDNKCRASLRFLLYLYPLYYLELRRRGS